MSAVRCKIYNTYFWSKTYIYPLYSGVKKKRDVGYSVFTITFLGNEVCVFNSVRLLK